MKHTNIYQSEWEKIKSCTGRESCRQKINACKSVIILIVVNILLLGGVASIFANYENRNIEERIIDDVLGLKDDGSMDITRQIKRALSYREEDLHNIANYMEAAELSMEDAEVYIDYMQSMDGLFFIYDIELGQMYSVEGKKDTRINESVLAAVNEAMVKEEISEFQMTDSFVMPDINEQAVAFWIQVQVDHRECLLIEAIPLMKALDDVFTNREMAENRMLIDSKGQILLDSGKGFMEEDKRIARDFYASLQMQFTEDSIQELAMAMEADSNGRITLKDSTGKKWSYVFGKVDDVYDWIYIYASPIDMQNFSEKAKLFMLGIILLMLSVCIMDVGIVFVQNRRLHRGMTVIEAKNRELELANSTKDIFISSMSHEIRTPINAVLGLDEMIIRECDDENILEYARNIKSAGKSLLGTVNDILDFTKMESGKLTLIEDHYDLASVVNDLYAMTDARMKEKKLIFRVKINESIPHILMGDEIRLKQIILNLLTNAVKYTEQGEVSLFMDYKKLTENRIALMVRVKDTGIGIKGEDKERLFSPFERLEERRNRGIEGTGLGLSIVLRLLALMDSKLEVESVYGQGSEFSFVIEQEVVDWKGVGSLTQMIEASKSLLKEKRGVLFAPDASVLIVDDNTTNLMVAEGLLKRTQVNIETAQSGEECLKRLAHKKYDIVLLDHRMPGMDGVETLHHIKKLENENANTPVIVLTANAMAGAKEEYLQEGFTDFLSKPVNGNKLEAMVKQYLPKELIWHIDKADLKPEEGLKHCGTKELYIQTLKDFLKTAPARIEEIKRLFEQQDYDNYTIKVHALKSAARLVGAVTLSEMAAHLEQCGKDGQFAVIQEETEQLLSQYQRILMLKETGQEEAPVKSDGVDAGGLSDLFIEALEAIREFNEAFDFDQIDEIMKQLEDCQLTSKESEAFSRLKIAVFDVNQEEIRSIVETLL